MLLIPSNRDLRSARYRVYLHHWRIGAEIEQFGNAAVRMQKTKMLQESSYCCNRSARCSAQCTIATVRRSVQEFQHLVQFCLRRWENSIGRGNRVRHAMADSRCGNCNFDWVACSTLDHIASIPKCVQNMHTKQLQRDNSNEGTAARQLLPNMQTNSAKHVM